MSSRTEAIRLLLSRFPALKPKAIERLLAARGVEVDANLIGVTRLRQRRKEQAENVILDVLGKLLTKHGHLLPLLQASLKEVIEQVVDVVAAHPGFTDDQLADELAKLLAHRPVEETLTARWGRIFQRLLDEHPQYRRSMKLVHGLQTENYSIVSYPIGENLDDLTDEQMEQALLAYLDKNYPAGPTVEAIANTYLNALQQRHQRAQEERRSMAQAEQDRAARVLALVLDALRGHEDLRTHIFDHADLRALVEQHIAEFADWPDADITERAVAGMDWAINHCKKPKPHIDGLNIRKRI